MSMNNYTQGPWSVSQETGGRNGIQDSKGNYIAFTSLPYKIDQTQNDGESWLDMRQRIAPQINARDRAQEANARLIAAAPDMLEALEEIARLPVIVGYADGPCIEREDMRMVRAAIVKAKGEMA